MSDQTVHITGASRGLGAAVAEAFAEPGTQLLLSAREGDALEKTAERVREAGARATVAPMDVRDEDAVFETLAGTVTDPIDVLVACAGVSPEPPGDAPITETHYGDFDAAVATNARGLFATLREGVQFMAEDGRVLVPSGTVARETTEGMGAYGVSKAAAEGVVRGFAADASQTVGLVYPGLIATDLTRGQGRDPESVAEMFVWAATDCPPAELNGEAVDLKQWKRATRG